MNIKNTIHSARNATTPSHWLRPALIALAVLGTAFAVTGCGKDDDKKDDSKDHTNHPK